MISDRKEAILFIAKKQHGGKRELIGEIGEKFFSKSPLARMAVPI